jgi:predicted  nucleic acid-binding Zn-ribbon protein
MEEAMVFDVNEKFSEMLARLSKTQERLDHVLERATEDRAKIEETLEKFHCLERSQHDFMLRIEKEISSIKSNVEKYSMVITIVIGVIVQVVGRFFGGAR